EEVRLGNYALLLFSCSVRFVFPSGPGVTCAGTCCIARAISGMAATSAFYASLFALAPGSPCFFVQVCREVLLLTCYWSTRIVVPPLPGAFAKHRAAFFVLSGG
ncbi:unnamed protein product, partial [Phaeothamnion confervicola]